ncbi:MAG: IS30 family transposase [Nitrospira sp. CG24B]|nr:MAG: IS30 family transposase [Nitrospira sp. CG24B]
MGKMGRPRLSAVQKADLWQRWKQGQSLSEIGRALGKHAGSIHGLVSSNGGFIPPVRQRARWALTLAEREEISRGLATVCSIRQIAATLGRAPSTISREIHRHGGAPGYRASVADGRAWERARRPKLCRLATNPMLQRMVASKLALEWSPEQIAGWLKREFPAQDTMQISHETIYRSLFIQARGVLKKELLRPLRSRRMMRRAKRASTASQPRGQIIDGISIRDRPADVEDRAIPGHWEGDLIAGSKITHIATLVERQSRFTMLVKVPGKDTASVVTALSQQIRRLPSALRRSLTWDRGMELAQHKRLTIATNVQVYFCDPQSPWQRGTNENTNRLLRQYFSKGTDLSRYSQADLDRVALRLNQRPRKTLGFQTPAAILGVGVAHTG